MTNWFYRLRWVNQRDKLASGGQLVAEAETRLRALACAKINLQTHQGNRGAVEFWWSLGYAEEERVRMKKAILSSGPVCATRPKARRHPLASLGTKRTMVPSSPCSRSRYTKPSAPISTSRMRASPVSSFSSSTSCPPSIRKR